MSGQGTLMHKQYPLLGVLMLGNFFLGSLSHLRERYARLRLQGSKLYQDCAGAVEPKTVKYLDGFTDKSGFFLSISRHGVYLEL